MRPDADGEAPPFLTGPSLAALFAASVALRPQLVGIAPLLPLIQVDLQTSHVVLGLLGTIPVVCMGVFAATVSLVIRRFGTKVPMTAALGAITGFGLLRAAAGNIVEMVLLTVGLGVGMGLAAGLLPVIVKERWPLRPGLGTGIYAAGIQTGSAVSAAIAIPIALGMGWRPALAAFALGTSVILAVWHWSAPNLKVREPLEQYTIALPIRSPFAWHLVSIFVLNSVCYFGLTMWLPAAYMERGWVAGDAGSIVAILNGAAIPTCIAVALLSDGRGTRRAYLAVSCSVLLVSVVGTQLQSTLAVFWALLGGLALGGIFPLVLTLPLDATRHPREAAPLIGLMLGAGYLIGAATPAGLGLMRDLTGTFNSVLWVVGIAAAGLLLLVLSIPETDRDVSATA